MPNRECTIDVKQINEKKGKKKTQKKRINKLT